MNSDLSRHPGPGADLPERAPLDRAALSALSAAGRWHVEVVERSPSTNADVSARARDGGEEGLVLVAEHQTAGRGRLDRSWVTPARSSLTLSVLLTPEEVPVARWPWLPLLTGLAVAEAVRRTGGVHAELKWPNDVLVDGCKVAGILVERVEGPHGAAAVVGIGLNVSLAADELPVETATSLELAAGRPVDRTALLVDLLEALGGQYDRWRGAGGDATAGLKPAYEDACATVGREVRVDLPSGGTAEGRALGVDFDGRLVVRTGAGPVVLGAGDVVHVRPRGSEG